MKQGSNNYKKQKLKLQKLHSHIANQRKDFLHKLSNQITNDYKLICFEDLNLSNIKRCLKLGKATSDNGFGMFRIIVVIKMMLLHYLLKNANCGALNQRDTNAALNIRDEGYRVFLAS